LRGNTDAVEDMSISASTMFDLDEDGDLILTRRKSKLSAPKKEGFYQELSFVSVTFVHHILKVTQCTRLFSTFIWFCTFKPLSYFILISIY